MRTNRQSDRAGRLAQPGGITSPMPKNRSYPNFAGKTTERIQKPFRMISLRKIRQQLPWIDILTKNTGGVGGTLSSDRSLGDPQRPRKRVCSRGRALEHCAVGRQVASLIR